MKSWIFEAAIVTIIMSAFLFNNSLQAQPLSKRIGYKTLNDTAKQVLIPINNSNYKIISIGSKNVYVLRHKENESNVKPNNSEELGEKENGNFFINQKRHLLASNFFHKNKLTQVKPSKNIFLRQKRHGY